MRKNIVIFILIMLITALAISLFLIKNVNTTKTSVVKVDKMESHSIVPIASNQWYSNIYKKFPTQPLYAFPLAFKITPSGLGLSMPEVVPTPNTIFATYNEDFSVGLLNTMEKPQITSIGDWSVSISQKSGSQKMSYTISQGVPDVVFHQDSEVKVLIPKPFKVFVEGTVS